MSVINPSTFTILTYRAFEPTEISGLKAWYKADSIAQADGSSVSAWLDSSGNEAHMYQSTSATQPTYQTNELNGLPVVRFDGTDDFMNLTAPFDYLTNNTVGGLNATSCSPDGTYFVHANAGASPTIVIYKKTGNVFNKLDNPATLPAGTVYSSNFSNDGNYLAVPSGNSPFIQIYKRTGDTFTKLANPATLPTGSSYYAHFSYDDSYLIVSHDVSPFITIYSINKSTDTFTKLSNPASLPSGLSWCSKFSSNNSYLCVGLNVSPWIEFYSISAGVLTKLSNPTTIPTNFTYTLDWLDDSTCFIAGNSSTVRLYQYSSSTGKFEEITNFLPALGTITACSYSRNKNYLAIAGGSTPFFKIFSRSGTTYTALSNPATLPTGAGRGIAWGANDNAIVVSHSTAPNIQAYTFDGTTLTNLTKLNMFRNVGGGTVFVVVKYPASLANNPSFMASIGTGGGGTHRLSLNQSSTTKFRINARRLDADAESSLISTQSVTSNYFIQTALIDYTNGDGYQYLNGKIENTNLSFLTNGSTSDTNSIAIRLATDSTNFLNGDIAEVIAFNRALTTAEIRDVHYYLSAKYNITLAT